MKLIPYILYLFLISFHRTVLAEIISIQGVTMNLAILITALIAIYKEETIALWFAVSVGIVVGSMTLSTMPWQILALSILALMVNQISIGINLDSIASRILLLGGVIFVYSIVDSLLISTDNFLFAFYRYVLPQSILTLLVAWLFLLIKDGHITWTKLKSLF